MKNHDENKDINILIRNKVYVNVGQKTIKAPKDRPIGNRLWGRIDFLTNYKGYHFIWDNSIVDNSNNNEDSEKKKNLRSKKENKHFKNNVKMYS